MSIDHGKVLTKLLELASQLERNANIDFNNPYFTQGRREAYRDSAKQIRALAQPAEAVEGGKCRMCGAPCTEHKREIAPGDYVTSYRYEADAAQGAVAPFGWAMIDNRRAKIEFTNLQHVADEWMRDPGLIVERLYTHPQAAPAQVDEEAAWREGWALAYSGAQYLYGDDGELQDNRWPKIDWRRDSAMEIRQKIYERGMRALAAAPSQEGES